MIWITFEFLFGGAKVRHSLYAVLKKDFTDFYFLLVVEHAEEYVFIGLFVAVLEACEFV